VNGEKLAKQNYGLSLIFTKAEWFTGAASLSSEVREKLCGLKTFLSQRKRLVGRQQLAVISPVAARLYAVLNCSQIW
jgi:hypothetical protein